uniref:BACK domain-containing protein n=1 Tax=Daucus carota subsp. sativus TaxID=79200 RepID=A0A164YBH0_DAUCS
MAEAVQPLTDAAKQFLAVRYRDISKFTDEVMRLPLASIEAIFSCDDLQVASEDFVYHLILKWSRPHYPELEERQEILVSRLSRFIRFPYMSCGKLKKVLTCTDFDHEECLNLFPSGRVYSQVFHLGGQAESTPSNTRATTLLLGARQWATGTFLVFHGLSSFLKTVNTSFINGVLHLRAELTIR